MCKKSLCKIIKRAVRVPKEIPLPDGEMVLVRGAGDSFSLMEPDKYDELGKSIVAGISVDEKMLPSAKRMARIILAGANIVTVKGGRFKLPENYNYLKNETELEVYVSGDHIKFEKRDTESES